MTRKIMAMVVVICVLCSVVTVASAGDIIGTARRTATVTYINNYAIPSYNINGYMYIVAEDLGAYGFDVRWNEYDKSLRIFRNKKVNAITGMAVYRDKPRDYGKKRFDAYTQNVRVFLDDYVKEIPGYAGIPGSTLIWVDYLGFFGDVQWVSDLNQIKAWIRDGLEIRGVPEYIPFEMSSVTASPYHCEYADYYVSYSLCTSDTFYVWFSLYDKDSDGYASQVYDDSCRLYVDIINENGQTIHQGNKYLYSSSDMTISPYLFVDNYPAPYSYQYTIPRSKISNLTDTVLVKVYYWCSYCGYGIPCEYYVDV